MSYINDPREAVFDSESGVILEQDNRHEEKYQWGAMIIDLCDMPVSEYMKPMTVIGLGGGESPETGETMYTVKFVIDGVIVQQENLKSGEPIPFNINGEKEDRTFIGWYYGSTKYTEGSLMPNKSITLTAKYECNVSFIIVEDGKETVILTYSVNYNTKPSNIPSVSKDGYIFNGWEPSTSLPITAHTTYYGEYTPIIYTVVWNGYMEGPITQEYKYGETLIAPISPEKEGYTFNKWDKQIPQIVTSDLIFNAVFDINQYNIDYNIEWNGEKTPFTSFTANYGTAIPTAKTITEKGYTFSEWESEYKGKTVPAFNVEYISKKTVNSYILAYYVNNKLTKEDTYEYLSKITPYEYTPEEGYVASEWNGLPENLIMPYNNISAYCTTEIMKFTVVFIDQNGNELSRNEDIPYGTEIDTILPIVPEGYHYTYDETIDGVVKENLTINVNVSIGMYRVNINGESVLIEYGTNIISYINGNYVPEEGYYLNIKNITHETVPGEHDKASVEFTFEPNVWVLSYSTEGADENLNGSLDVAYGTYVLSALPLTTKEHYNFGGWFNNGTLITSEFTMPNNDLIVNGNYLVNSYTVKVIDENGEEIFNKFYPYKTKLNTILTENEVVEYINSQIGYDINFSVNGEIINENMIIDSNINVTVNKTPKKYILTFKNDEEIISSTEVEFGSVILYPTMENKNENGVEYVFVWEDESYNGKLMPSNNLTIVGNYQEKAEAPIYYGVFVTSSTTADSKIYNDSDLNMYFKTISVSECLNEAEVDISMKADEKAIEFIENDDWDGFDEYCDTHKYPSCFLIPVEVDEKYTFAAVLKADGAQKNFVTDKIALNINGVDYYLYAYLTNAMMAADIDQTFTYKITLK